MRPSRLRMFISAVVPGVLGLFLKSAQAGAEFPFEVREAAGIRRRSDVVTARLPAAEVGDSAALLRLLKEGEPIPAQVRLITQSDGSTEWVVDFIDHFAPLESRRYVLEVVDASQSVPPEPAGGLDLAESAERYTISSGGVVHWSIRKDLQGLLDFSWKETDYIADDSLGLFFVSADGKRLRLSDRSPDRAVVERSGPIACSLEFEYRDWPPGDSSRVTLEFPRTKSWVHAVWTINDGAQGVDAIGAELKLALDGSETLIDFGAGDFVYATVTAEQSAMLEAGPRDSEHVPWQVLHGPREAMLPIVVASDRDPTAAVRGWAHVMDSRRCTALALADFGEQTADAIQVDGGGTVTWLRQVRPATGTEEAPRRLEFWLHFVTMPVHIGARTSPRSMQEPLEVRRLTE